MPKGTTSRGDPSMIDHDFQTTDMHGSVLGVDAIHSSSANDAAKSLGMDLSHPAVRSLLAACAGATRPSDKIRFDERGGGQLCVRVFGEGFYAEVVLRRPEEANGGKLVARLERMDNDSSRSGKSGVEVFANQVKALRRAGCSHLFLDAAGSSSDDTFNGYYSWPRMGCEANLTRRQMDALPREWRKQMGTSRSLQDLFSLGGGDVWRRHGDHVYCWFELDPASRNSHNLERYVRSRQEGGASFSLPTAWSQVAHALFARRRSGGWEKSPDNPAKERKRSPTNLKKWMYRDVREDAEPGEESAVAPPPAAPARPPAARATDPVRQVTAANVGPTWHAMRDEIANHDPKLSFNLAGEIAALRIVNAYRKWSGEFRAEMDRRAKSGGNISDEDDALYGELGDRLGAISRKLETLSGVRDWHGVGEHPLANRPLDAPPLEDVLGRQKGERADARARADRVKVEADAGRAARAKSNAEANAAYREKERASKARREQVALWERANLPRYPMNFPDAIPEWRKAAREKVTALVASGAHVPPEVLKQHPPDAGALFAARLDGYQRGRSLHQKIFSSPEYLDLRSARAAFTYAKAEGAKRATLEIQRAISRMPHGASRGEMEAEAGRVHAAEHAKMVALKADADAKQDVFLGRMLEEMWGGEQRPGVPIVGLAPGSDRPGEEVIATVTAACGGAGALAARLDGEPPLPGVGFDFKAGRDPQYVPRYGVVRLPTKGTDMAQVMHELGHHLELHLTGASEACRAFYEHRRGGEPIRPLSEIDPATFGSYDPSAAGIGDRFDAIFGDGAAYTGRYYNRTPPATAEDAGLLGAMRSSGYAVTEGAVPPSTELLSRGLEFLITKPHRFAKDPEFFCFLAGVLDGTLRRPKPVAPPD